MKDYSLCIANDNLSKSEICFKILWLMFLNNNFDTLALGILFYRFLRNFEGTTIAKLNVLCAIIKYINTVVNLRCTAAIFWGFVYSPGLRKKIPTAYNDEPGTEPIHFASLIVSTKAQILYHDSIHLKTTITYHF